MRPRSAVTGLAALALVATAVPARATTHTIAIDDYLFSPSSKTVRQGDAVRWENGGAATHTSTRAGVVRWNSGDLDGSWCCRAFSYAGAFSYVCSNHGWMDGSILVPIGRSPTSGTTSTTFRIYLGTTAPPTGYAYDVQRRKGSGDWTTYRAGATTRYVTFRASSSGTYSFRSRIRRTSTGAASAYSPYRSVTVP